MSYIALLIVMTVLGILAALVVETVLSGLRAAGRAVMGASAREQGGAEQPGA